eukprot:TRINITY_DN803_c0_g1_i1.p1 TRINITY_DN803_c0_g1~~TRINITY_DN803_c0_g1_i1.p1  ORF type:complete len:282 (+),score=24.82 TRINITY_DN803_c0_g1_i1:47-847(+)
MAGTIFEKWWIHLTQNYSEFTISTIFTLGLHVAILFFTYVPYVIADLIPQLQQYKLQKDKKNTWELQIRCLKTVAFSHFCVQPILIVIGHYFLKHLGMEYSTPLPSWPKIAVIIIGCFIVEDFYFYWIHRFLHANFWYKFIHKIHHDHAAPFGIAAEYAHPLETVFLGFGTVLGPFVFCRHMFVLWVWLFFRVFQTIEAHCGYDFPWSPRHWIPFWGGAEFHDFHHETFSGNFSSTFTIWDRVFGTDVKYRERKEKKTMRETEKTD